MRVLFVCPTTIFGGGEVYLQAIIDGTVKDSSFSQVALISPANKLTGLVDNQVLLFKGYDTNSPINYIKLLKKINYLNKLYRYDAIFLNGFNEIGWCAPFILNSRVYSCGHNNFTTFKKPINTGKATETIINLLKRPLQYFFVQLAFMRFTQFVCINELVMNNLSSIVNHNKLYLIRNGVAQISVLPKKEGDPFTIGRIGRLVPLKGNDELIQAFCEYRKKGGKGRMIFAGKGPDENRLKTIAEKLGLSEHIEFLGFVEKERFFSMVDITVSSSSYETSPLVIMESMSCKKAVFATRVGGVPEIIQHNQTGILVDSGDTSQMADAMFLLETNQNLRKRLEENAFALYHKKFTSEKMVSLTVNMMKG